MTFEEFRADVYKYLKNKPSYYRKGQAVFNYIEEKYNIAREVQFVKHVDCFYDDSQIEHFIEKSFEVCNSKKIE